MRIALTITTFDARRGGAEGFACRVVGGLRRAGHQVHVFAEAGGSDTETGLTLTPLAQAGAPIADGAFDLHIDWGLNIPADLHRLGGGVHAAFMRYNALSVPAWIRPYKRLEQALGLKHRRIRHRERTLFRNPNASFLAVSDFVAEHLRKVAGIPEERIYTVVNGVPLDRFNFHQRLRYRTEIRHVLGLDDSHLVFLFVAHNPRLKNLALLKSVFAEFHRRVPTARLLVMGRKNPGTMPPWMLSAGDVSMPERIYAAADVMVHPTFFDACANVVPEAMACGCPAISSDCNGSAQIIEDGVNGRVLPVAGMPAPEIRRLWYGTMMELAEDPARRRRMGRAAASLIRTHYSMESYLEKFLAVLEACRRRKTNPPPA